MGRERLTPKQIIGKLSDELLNAQMIDTFLEASVLTEAGGGAITAIGHIALCVGGRRRRRRNGLKISLQRWYREQGQVSECSNNCCQ